MALICRTACGVALIRGMVLAMCAIRVSRAADCAQCEEVAKSLRSCVYNLGPHFGKTHLVVMSDGCGSALKISFVAVGETSILVGMDHGAAIAKETATGSSGIIHEDDKFVLTAAAERLRGMLGNLSASGRAHSKNEAMALAAAAQGAFVFGAAPLWAKCTLCLEDSLIHRIVVEIQPKINCSIAEWLAHEGPCRMHGASDGQALGSIYGYCHDLLVDVGLGGMLGHPDPHKNNVRGQLVPVLQVQWTDFSLSTEPGIGVVEPWQAADFMQMAYYASHARGLDLAKHVAGACLRELQSAVAGNNPHPLRDILLWCRDLPMQVVASHPAVVDDFIYSISSVQRAGLFVLRPEFVALKDRFAELEDKFYNFIGGSGTKPDDDTVVLTVVRGNATKEVVFSRHDSDAAIKEAICLGVGIPVGTVIRLMDGKDRVVAITGRLKPGEYTVTVVPPVA
jgi:hypothetical protein